MEGITALRELVAEMKALGLSSAVLADGTSATLAHPRGPVAPVVAAAPVAQLSCECKHKLSRHTRDGRCLERGPGGRPCQGKCKLIEGGAS